MTAARRAIVAAAIVTTCALPLATVAQTDSASPPPRPPSLATPAPPEIASPTPAPAQLASPNPGFVPTLPTAPAHPPERAQPARGTTLRPRVLGACEGRAFGAINFLLGRWSVSDANGAPAGHDDIIHALGNCGFYEYWRDARNHRAFAIFAYQPGAESWHLTWLEDTGAVVNLDGSPTPKTLLVMDGADYMGATRRQHRIEWLALPNGIVEKRWTQSTDGRHWTLRSDGFYTRDGR